jgi:hypothetical protein
VDAAVEKAEATAKAGGEEGEEAHTEAKDAVAEAAADHAAVDSTVLETAEVAPEDSFDHFMAKAQKHAESEMETTTKALTGHLSVSAIPASQLQKLAAMAQAELAKRRDQDVMVTNVPVPIPEALSLETAPVSAVSLEEVPAVSLEEIPEAKSEVSMPPLSMPPSIAKAVPITAAIPSMPEAPKNIKPMAKPTSDISAIIKASVAQALGNSGVEYDESAVDAALLQEQN